jgi:hypothetical protein
MKKGQITMEALLLYGAAILVVLLAVAALIYFGVLDLGVFLPEKCQFTGSGSLTCEDWSVSSAGTIDMEFSNKGTKSVQINAATFESSDTGLIAGCSLVGSTPTIAPGGRDIIQISCSTFEANTNQKISGKVRLTTVIGGGTLTHNMVGDLTATVG